MKAWLRVAAAMVAVGGGPAMAAPLEAYGRLPAIETAALSPDGAMLAYSVTDGEKRAIIIKDLETGANIRGLNVGEHKIRGIAWAGSNHLIITQSSTGYIPFVESARGEWFLAIDYNLTKKTLHPLNATFGSRQVGDTLNVVGGPPEIRIIGGRPIAFTKGVMFVNQRGQTSLFKVDLDRDDVTDLVDEGRPHTDNFLVDAQGNPLAASEYDAVKKQWVLRIFHGVWHTAQSIDAPIERPAILGLGRDGASIEVGFPNGGHEMLRELSPDGTKWTDPAPAPDRMIYDDASHRWIGQVFQAGDETRVEFFDPTDQKIWRALNAAYPGDRVSLVSASDDHRKFVLRVDSLTDGPAFAFVDINTKKGSWIGAEYAGLKAADISPVQPVSFKAADGLALTGYLTLPRGAPAKGLPLVVLPHGGPAARDEPGFDWWSQALASRGYAVLRVNYRGSFGYGWGFQSAGFGQWGRKMQSDLSDGVRYLAAQGTIDAKRVCIVGGSYGGYAALAGATLDPGVYRCAASLAGPADLARMIDYPKFEGSSDAAAAERYWLRYMGPREGLAAISPAQQAAKATIPILLIHGKDDTVVPYEQSQIMADALRKAGKPVDFVTLNKEDHWLSQGATRLQMLQAVVAFLEKNNPPN